MRLFRNLTPEQRKKSQEQYEKRKAEESVCAKVIDSFFRSNPDEIYWIATCLFAASNNCLYVTNEGEAICGVSIYDDKKGNRVFFTDVDNSVDQSVHSFCQELKNNFEQHSGTLTTIAFETASFFANQSKEWLQTHNLYAFQYMLAKWGKRNSSAIGCYFQSEDLTELVSTLLNIDNGASLFNPYAGICNYIVEITKYANVEYEAQELSENWILTNFDLYFHGRKPICVKADSSRDWPNRTFDYIVSTPPFGCKIVNEKGEKSTLEVDYLQRAINGYSKKIIGVLSAGLCNCSDRQMSSVRKQLVDSDELESVILLPNGALGNTSVKPAIFVANKEKSRKGYVRFVDVSEYDTSYARDFYYAEDPIDEAIEISISDIADNAYNLYPPFYLDEEIHDVPAGMKVVSLNDILSFLPTSVYYGDDERYIHTEDVDQSLSGIIEAEEFPLTLDEDNSIRYQHVKQSCLIVISSTRFHIGYLKMETPVNVNLPYLTKAFEIRDNAIDPAYLVSEMRKPYFTKQLSRFSAGTTFNRVKAEEILCCKIIVPANVETQAALALKEQQALFQKKVKEKEALYKKQLDEFVIGQRERKHAVAQVLNEIVPTLNNLKLFMEKQDSFNASSVVSPRSSKTFGDCMTALLGQVQQMVTMVDNFTNLEKFHPAKNIVIEEFLSNYCNSKVNPTYKAIFDSRLSVPAKVSISSEELTQILDNLFTNAFKYGFTDSERKDYVIRVVLEEAYTIFPGIVIRVLNNGIPAVASISPKKIFVWGEGKGSGIGCWQVKEIAEHFGGSVYFHDHSAERDDFATEFELFFPIIIE